MKLTLKKIIAVSIFFFLYLLLPWLPSPVTSLQFFPTEVSFIQLTANPILFHNRRVKILGFVSIEFEGSYLYFLEENYTHNLYDRIALDVKNSYLRELYGENELHSTYENLSLNYFIVEGTFNAFCCSGKSTSHGKINYITRMDWWSDPAIPKRVLRPLLNVADRLLKEGLSREKVSQLTGLSLRRMNQFLPED